MGLLKRLGDCLFNPKEILQYKIDKTIVTLLYFLFLSVILMIPNFIAYFTNMEVFDYELRTNIRYDLFNQNEIPYEVENGQLKFTGTNEKTEYYVNSDTYNVTIVFTTQKEIITNDEMNRTIIIFNSDGISLKRYTGNLEIIKYSELESIEGIDFKKMTTNDRVFWDQMTDVLKELEKSYQSLIVTLQVLIIIIRSIGTLLLSCLFLTLIGRISAQNIYSFGIHLKLTIYYMTPFVFGVVLANLFGITLLEYIGLIVTFIYSLRINQINFTGGNDNEL